MHAAMMPNAYSDEEASESSGENNGLVSPEAPETVNGSALLDHRQTTSITGSETEEGQADSQFLAENKKMEDDDGGDLVEGDLTEDIYSLIFTAPFKSGAFLFSIFMFLFQMTIIVLVIYDLLDHFNRGSNPLNVPPGTTTQVQVALALALLLAVATQGDLITAVVMLQQGWHKQILESNPYATFFKFLLSSFLQALAGVTLLLTIFILCVQSNTVIGMMLNFAALAFISEIDDVAFMLAKSGFISDNLEYECNHVCDLKVPVKRTSKVLRRILFLVIYAGLMAGYGVILHQQRSGKFLCQSIFVQFGDGFTPAAAAFSGIYDQMDKLINGRVTYIERNSQQAMIGYCNDENAWTVTFWFEDEPQEFQENPCKWVAKSPETESFDVTTTSDSTWTVDGDRIKKAQPFQFFVLQCVDCDDSAKGGPCSGNGQCDGNACVCEDGWYGTACEFDQPCANISVDARTNSFPANDFATDVLSDNYVLLPDENGELVMVYGRPVYAFEDAGIDWSVMMFTGRRWIVFSTLLQFETPTRAELVSFLKNDYHAFFNGVAGFFASDPMDVGTPSDAFTPVGLGWYKTRTNSDEGLYLNDVDTSQDIGTSMLCAICDYVEGDDDDAFVENACFFGGFCTSEGVCNCTEGFEGALCELDTFET